MSAFEWFCVLLCAIATNGLLAAMGYYLTMGGK